MIPIYIISCVYTCTEVCKETHKLGHYVWISALFITFYSFNCVIQAHNLLREKQL